MAIKTYPLNDIDYQAEDAELFHCTRTSGVYASGHFPVSVTGTDNNITIGKGIGWLKNTEFSGKVFASKEETTLNAGVPDASLPRVDAVVVRFDANQNETYFTIKQGSTGSTPTPPQVERGEYIYELHLYHIRRRPGATAITPGDITDLRMDANYCGLMADSVTQVDMSAINAQIREFISDWENQIANVTDGNMIEAPEYPGCYYRMNRGVKEWLNPPMMEDVEYPTTKRQDGKRVYTKLLKARSMAGSVSLPDIERIVSVFAVAERDWNGEKLMFQLPVDFLPKDAPTIQKMQIYYQENRIVFQSVVAKGMYDLYITVEYTKPGEEVAYTNVTADCDNMIVDTSGDTSAQGDNLNVEMFTTVSADGGAYIRRLTINGVAYDLAVGQAGSGVPGTAYPGVPGMFYTNIDSGAVYVCLKANPALGIYVWSDIIPENLYVKNIKFRHDIGIGYAEITADKQVVNIQNDGADAVVRGVADPVEKNDVANKQYVDRKIGSGGVTNWDNLEDKPTYVQIGPRVVEWNGAMDGDRFEIDEPDSTVTTWLKISDEIPGKEELIGAAFDTNSDHLYPGPISAIKDGVGCYDSNDHGILVVTQAGEIENPYGRDGIAPSTGIYVPLWAYEDETSPYLRLSYGEYSQEKFDPTWLPDGGFGWEGPGGKTDILPETELLMDEDTPTVALPDGRTAYAYAFYPLPPTLDDGEECQITIDGVVHQRKCAPVDDNSGYTLYYIGNLSLTGVGEDTGEDWMFIFQEDNPSSWFGTFLTTNTEYKTLAISGQATVVHQIMERFIPASIARKSDLPDPPSPAAAVPDAVGEAPTASEFNALLAALRAAGYLATE